MLFVDGGPNNEVISFLFDLLTTKLICFFSKKCTPWCFTTLFKVQFVINKNIKILYIICLMNSKYINIYNNLVNLTRNKQLYKNFDKQDTFSDRLIYLLLHFAFFLKVFKNDDNKDLLQEIYDYVFRQLELSIREIGYGDQSINKKMKDYLNLFYAMIDKIHDWDSSSDELKKSILFAFLDNKVNEGDLVKYFDEYEQILSNNTLNFYLKGVVKA